MKKSKLDKSGNVLILGYETLTLQVTLRQGSVSIALTQSGLGIFLEILAILNLWKLSEDE